MSTSRCLSAIRCRKLPFSTPVSLFFSPNLHPWKNCKHWTVVWCCFNLRRCLHRSLSCRHKAFSNICRSSATWHLIHHITLSSPMIGISENCALISTCHGLLCTRNCLFSVSRQPSPKQASVPPPRDSPVSGRRLFLRATASPTAVMGDAPMQNVPSCTGALPATDNMLRPSAEATVQHPHSHDLLAPSRALTFP